MTTQSQNQIEPGQLWQNPDICWVRVIAFFIIEFSIIKQCLGRCDLNLKISQKDYNFYFITRCKKIFLTNINNQMILTRVGFGMEFFGIPNRDRDFLFRARSKNPEIPGIGIWKTLKNPESKIPKIPGIGIWIGKSRKNPEWEIPKILESRGFSRDGISRQKATSDLNRREYFAFFEIRT